MMVDGWQTLTSEDIRTYRNREHSTHAQLWRKLRSIGEVNKCASNLWPESTMFSITNRDDQGTTFLRMRKLETENND
jgi:hypothetical protein